MNALKPTRLASAILLLVLLAALAGTGAAQKKKRYKGITFVPTYAEALEEAAGRGCPILVCITNELSHEQATRFLYEEKGIIKLSREFVCVVSHENIAHTSEYGKRQTKKHKGKMCPFYGTITCKQHAAASSAINNRFIRNTVVQQIDTPQHIYVSPVGDEEMFRRRGPVGIRDMKYDLKRALKEIGPSLDRKKYLALKKHVEAAERGLAKSQIRPVSRALTEFKKLKKRHAKVKSALFTKGDALIAKLEAEAKKRIDEARDYAKKGQKARAIEVLEAVAREFGAFGKEKARQAIRDIETGKP